MKRIEEYQKINKDWEYKVLSIRNNINELEENNKSIFLFYFDLNLKSY